jgi:hypothetical protein
MSWPKGPRAPKLGTGKRFSSLKEKLSQEPGVTDPGALAGAIGRKKYGNAKMNSMAQSARKKKPFGNGFGPGF